MGPGGSRRLQNGCSASFLVEGGFDSHAPPPLEFQLKICTSVLAEAAQLQRITSSDFWF
jgi:hypothetical protein